jgi:endonuclease III
MGGGDIAYDVHVRRVFLRTGLASRDEVTHMVVVARALNPERPGALDLPAWDVGRRWCRPTSTRLPGMPAQLSLPPPPPPRLSDQRNLSRPLCRLDCKR